MDFKQIEAYVKVIELTSFSKAAEAIFLSQPSVSTYINALEKELGTTLINRSTKEVAPTLAGKIFYGQAKELLALKSNTVEQIKNLSGNFSGEINILASSVPGQYILPAVIARFNAIYPQISFSVRQADTLEVARGVAGQQAEIGFCGGLVEDDKCDFYDFITEQMVLIAPPDGGFSATVEYSLEELMATQRFISRAKGSGTRDQYESYFTKQNVQPAAVNAAISFDNTQSIINAVINGLGVSIVSEFAARTYIENQMVLPLKIKTKLPQRKFYYVLKKNFLRSHLIDLLIEFLVSEYSVRT